MKKIANSVVLITGADGGIGIALLERCIALGAKKIYAAGLSLERLELIKAKYSNLIVPVVLDITDEDQIKNCSLQIPDVEILINNAGIELKASFLQESAAQKALLEMKVNYIGLINMINYFVPILEKNSQSLIVNILSVASSAVIQRLGTYCASKSAAHILTQSIKEDLAKKGIMVIAVYPGYVNTEMSQDVTHVEKASPESVAMSICEGIELGQSNIFTDAMAKSYFKMYPIAVNILD